MRPSASWAWPEQKRPDAVVTSVNACVAGFHTTAFDGVSHPSHNNTLPFGINDEWTATSGQLMSEPH
jgi:hypothetical protein